MTLGELREITTTVVRNRAQCYADPAMAAEVAAQVARYVLGIPNRFGPPGMVDEVNERATVIDVLEQVLNDIEAEETRPDGNVDVGRHPAGCEPGERPLGA